LILNKKGHRSFGSTFVTCYDPNDYFLQPTKYNITLYFLKVKYLRATRYKGRVKAGIEINGTAVLCSPKDLKVWMSEIELALSL